MDSSRAFQGEVDLLLTLAPSILASLPANHHYADLFYENTRAHSLFTESKSFSINASSAPFKERVTFLNGTGAQVFGPTVHAYNSIEGPPDKSTLIRCVEELPGVANTHGTKINLSTPQYPEDNLSALDRLSAIEKKQFLCEVLESAYSYEPYIRSASLEYQDRIQRICIIDSEGNVIINYRTFWGLWLRIKMDSQDGIIETDATHLSADPSSVFSSNQISALVIQAVNAAKIQSSALPIRSASYPVIFEGSPTSLLPLHQGNASIWLHETIGHLLEADQFNATLWSTIGNKVSSVPLSLSDDPLRDAPNPLLLNDDEGVKGACTNLVEEGRLKRILTDRYHSFQLNRELTGNGRRQDYRFAPLPRMTSLYLHPGDTSRESLISSVKDGIYVKSISHGQTHSDTQEVCLDVREGYRIKQGRLTHPIKNVTIKGKSFDILNQIEGIANDLPPRPQMVQCKKGPQVVPVSVASPSVLVKQMDVYQLNR